jgi:hypothetical protein
VKEDTYAFAQGEIERATNRIVEILTVLGSSNVLANLFQVLRRVHPVDFGLYLISRQYARGTGEPS